MGFRGFAGHFYGACEIQSDNISTWYCKDKIVTLIYDIECMLFHAIWLVWLTLIFLVESVRSLPTQTLTMLLVFRSRRWKIRKKGIQK